MNVQYLYTNFKLNYIGRKIQMHSSPSIEYECVGL